MTGPATTERIAALLRRAGDAHHQAFRHVNGEDAEWPHWYAEYLAAPLATLLGKAVEPAALASELSRLEAARAASGDSDWPRYYAERLARGAGEPAS